MPAHLPAHYSLSWFVHTSQVSTCFGVLYMPSLCLDTLSACSCMLSSTNPSDLPSVLTEKLLHPYWTALPTPQSHNKLSQVTRKRGCFLSHCHASALSRCFYLVCPPAFERLRDCDLLKTLPVPFPPTLSFPLDLNERIVSLRISFASHPRLHHSTSDYSGKACSAPVSTLSSSLGADLCLPSAIHFYEQMSVLWCSNRSEMLTWVPKEHGHYAGDALPLQKGGTLNRTSHIKCYGQCN